MQCVAHFPRFDTETEGLPVIWPDDPGIV